MLISDDDLTMIKDSFLRAKAVREFDRSPIFYENLFKRAPETRSMFRDDLAGQGMKFMGTMRIIVGALDDPAALDRVLKPLAEGHAALGVKAPDFAPMGEALIDTLKGVLGEAMTPEVEAAWRSGFDVISKRMSEFGKL